MTNRCFAVLPPKAGGQAGCMAMRCFNEEFMTLIKEQCQYKLKKKPLALTLMAFKKYNEKTTSI
jgi:hypothetical protein